MTANKTLLQMKYARIIAKLAETLNIPETEAMDIFYNSKTYKLVSEGISDFHCMSDLYLVDELISERGNYC